MDTKECIKESLEFLLKMFQKYHTTEEIGGYDVYTKESEKWFDSIIIVKRNIKL